MDMDMDTDIDMVISPERHLTSVTVRRGKSETGNGLQSSASRCFSCSPGGLCLDLTLRRDLRSLSNFWTFEPKSANNKWILLVLNVFLTMSMQSELNLGNNKTTKLVLDCTKTQGLQHPPLAATTEGFRGKELWSQLSCFLSAQGKMFLFTKSRMKEKQLK